jgi:glycerol uptake facilitator-like aquaporin
MSTVAGSVTRSHEARGFARLWRVTKQLFHEMVGAAFIALALGWLNSALRAYTRDVAHWIIAISVVVAAIFVTFAITSFRRASRL